WYSLLMLIPPWMQLLYKYMIQLTRYIVFFISAKTYQKILKPSLATNMIVLFGIFFCVVTVCARNFFIKDGQNSLKSILMPITTLMRALFPSRKSWARAFTSSMFTAGMQTTSRVDGYNNIIKRELVACSTLCDLESVLNAR